MVVDYNAWAVKACIKAVVTAVGAARSLKPEPGEPLGLTNRAIEALDEALTHLRTLQHDYYPDPAKKAKS